MTDETSSLVCFRDTMQKLMGCVVRRPVHYLRMECTMSRTASSASAMKPQEEQLDISPLTRLTGRETVTSLLDSLASLPHVTTPALVTLFLRLSRHYNPRSEDHLPDLEPLVDCLHTHTSSLSYPQLESLVEALTLWPEAVRRPSNLLHIPTRTDLAIRRMFDLLKLESNQRLSKKLVDKERFISMSSDNFLHILPLCKHWTHVDFSSPSINTTMNPFHNNYINHIGNGASKTSNRRFKHFTKDGFVQFCEVMASCVLFKDFHKYYCTVKFADLMDQMDEDDLGKVCRAFVTKDIYHGREHPMDELVKGRIIRFLIKHRATITSHNLWSMGRFLGLGGLPPSLQSDLLELQVLLEQENLSEGLQLRALLVILTVPQGQPHIPLVDQWVTRSTASLASSEEDGLHYKEMEAVGRLVARYRDTPAGRALVLRLAGVLGEQLEAHRDPKSPLGSVIGILLSLAQVHCHYTAVYYVVHWSTL